MEDLNRVIMISRLVRDAELKYTNSGLAVSSFSVAVNRRVKHGDNYEDEVSFFDLALFGKRAESLNQYLTKGQQVAVEGSLTQDRFEQDGQKRSKVKIIANNIQLLGGKTGQATQQNAARGQETASQGNYSGGMDNPTYGNPDDFEGDIPF